MEHRLPAPHLRQCIARYGGCSIPAAEPGITYGLPSQHVTLMIGLATPYRIIGSGIFDAFVGGLHERPTLVENKLCPDEGIHICLSPLGTRALLGVPASALGGLVVDLRDLIGGAADELIELLQDAPGWAQRFDILDRVFTRILQAQRLSGKLQHTMSQLVQSAGTVSIETLAYDTGWSRRHLTVRFREEFGLPPKAIARIVRFENACALLRRRRSPLADIATQAGFCDQAHMAREWNQLAGCSPLVWIRENLPFIQDYELAGLYKSS